ncbi:hypothetical protein [Kribbella flavida]|nr:hypothetical protein [Kribbella flavida]
MLLRILVYVVALSLFVLLGRLTHRLLQPPRTGIPELCGRPGKSSSPGR